MYILCSESLCKLCVKFLKVQKKDRRQELECQKRFDRGWRRLRCESKLVKVKEKGDFMLSRFLGTDDGFRKDETE